MRRHFLIDNLYAFPNVFINRRWFVKLALGFILVPNLVLALSLGDFAQYRASQVIWLGLLLLAVYLAPRQIIRPSSLQAWTMVIVLFLSGCITIITGSYISEDLVPDLVMKTVMFAGIVWSIDRLRGVGFESFAAYALPIALVMVIATSLHFMLFSGYAYGRYTFFENHPNLGGEVLFSCAAITIFARSLKLRLGIGILILFLLVLLQSRAAILGTLVVLVLGESMRLVFHTSTVARKQFFRFLFPGVIAIMTAALIYEPSILHRLIGFIRVDIFLVDDVYRGSGSELVGRMDTWRYGLLVYSENPFFGVGLDQTSTTNDGLAIHSGYISLFAEFGMLAVPLLLVVLSGLIVTWRQRSVRFAVIAV